MECTLTINIDRIPECIAAVRDELSGMLRDVADSQADPRVRQRLLEVATAFDAGVQCSRPSDVARLEALGRSGITVSVCCGPCGSEPFRWTVQALSRDGQEFDRPFAANDFGHAVEICELEVAQRAWARVREEDQC